MKTDMDTDTATRILADIHAYGADWNEQDRRLERAGRHIELASEYGREWEWELAGEQLDAAYRALGAENPGTGHEWHCGNHPIQLIRLPENDS